MLGLFAWIRQLGGRSRNKSRRTRASQRGETLEVRLLEERRVFHAGAVSPMPGGPGTTTPQPPPPPPTVTIAIDSQQNLVVQDTSGTGQNDQLTLRFDAEHQRYEISDPNQRLQTSIAGATGSGTNTVYIPYAAVAGEKLIFDTAGGDDSLTLDFSAGGANKSIEFLGGAGQQDALHLVGGGFDLAGYQLGAETSQILLAGGGNSVVIALAGIEPIFDDLAVANRQFTAIAPSGNWTLTGSTTGPSVLATSLGTSVYFAAPQQSLSLDAGQVDGSLQIGGQFHLAGSFNAHAHTLNLTGSITTPTGRVALDAGPTGTLRVSGRIDVSGTLPGQTGGTVHLLGRFLELVDDAVIEASGPAGGGTVLVGGDFQGKNPAIHNAENTFVGERVAIRANALKNGNGGKIIVWADDSALVYGSGNFQARGGTLGGNGGLIETSGKIFLAVGGAASASASHGSAGLWLLDPRNVRIVAGGTATLSGGVLKPTANDTTILASTIVTALNAGTNVTIYTGDTGSQAGNITVDEAMAVTGATNVTLTLNAANDVIVNQSISSAVAQLSVSLRANRTISGFNDDGDTAAGDVDINASISTNGGSFTSTGVNFDNTGGSITTAGGSVLLTHTGAVTVGSTVDSDGTLVNGNFTSNGTTFNGLATINTGGGNVNLNHTAAVAISGTVNTVGGSFSSAGTTFSNSGTGAITTAGGNLTLTHTGTVSIGSTVSTGGALTDGTFTSSGTSFTLTAAIGTDGGDFTLNHSGAVAISGAVSTGVGDFSSSGTTFTTSGAGAITTADGDVQLIHTGAVSLGNAVNTGGGDFASVGTTFTTVSAATLTTGGGTVTINHSGAVAIGGAVNTSGVVSGSFNSGGTTFSNTATINSGTADISLTHGGLITIGANLTATGSGRASVFTSGGGITFSGNSQIIASQATLSATGSIVSGTATQDIDTSASNGAISVTGNGGIGASGSPLLVKAGTGNVSLTTDTGSIFLQAVGSLDLAAVATGSGAQTVQILATDTNADINIVASSTAAADDNWILQAADDIEFIGNFTINAGSAALTAGGNLVSGTSTTADVNTSTVGGSIALSAAAGVGSSGNVFRVLAGAGTVTAATSAAGGDVFLASAGPLNLGAITTAAGTTQAIEITTTGATGNVTFVAASASSINDDWKISASGGIGFSGATTLTAASIDFIAAGAITSGSASNDIDTSAANGNIRLTGQGIGAAANEIRLDRGAGLLRLTATGTNATTDGIYVVQTTGDLLTGDVPILSAAATGATIFLVAENGAISIDSVSGWSISNDLVTMIAAGGNIEFSGNITLVAAQVTLAAGSSILGGTSAVADINTSAANGNVALFAVDGIGQASQPLLVRAGTGTVSADTSAGTGSIYLTSTGAMRLGTIRTETGSTQTVEIKTAGLLEIAAFSDTDDDWSIDSGGDLALLGPGSVKADRFLSLTAIGDLTSGTAAVDFDTSNSNSNITITAASIGTPDNMLVLNAGTGQLGLTALTGDLCVAIPTGDLDASRFVGGQISAQFNNVTIALATLNGSINLATLPNVDEAGGPGFTTLGNLPNNSLWLEARGTLGDIDLASQTLVSREITLIADGEIISSGALLDTSTTNGDITITSGGSVGFSGAPLAVEAGSGAVSVTTVAAGSNIFLASTGPLNLGTISTNAGTSELISIQSFNNVTIAAPILVDEDALEFIAQGDVAFVGTGSVKAAGVTISALGGSITGSGSGIDVWSTGGEPLVLLARDNIGGPGVSLAIRTTGEVSATTSLGNISLEVAGGSFQTSQFSTLVVGASGGIFKLTVADGSLLIDQSLGTGVASDNIVLTALSNTPGSGNIVFDNNATLSGASINLLADGAIYSDSPGTGLDISTPGGITLAADLGIGQLGDPLTLQTTTPFALVSLTTDTGDIFVEARSPLGLGAVTTGTGTQTVAISTTGVGNVFAVSQSSFTDDAWTISSSSDFTFLDSNQLQAASLTATAAGGIFGGAGACDIDTITPASPTGGNITLSGQQLGVGGNPLSLRSGEGLLSFTSASGIFARIHAGDLVASRVTLLSAAASGAQIELSTDGEIVLDDIVNAGAVTGFLNNTTDDNLILTAGEDIRFTGATTLTALTATLTAGGHLESGTAAVDLDTSATGGNITLRASGPIGERTIIPFLVNPFSVSAGTGRVFATTTGLGGNIHLHSVATLRIGGIVSSADAFLTSTDAILASGNLVDIDTSAANGEIELVAASLGVDGAPLLLNPGSTGDLRLAANAGNLFVAVTSGTGAVRDLRMADVRHLSAAQVGATVSLATTNGSLLLDDLAGLALSTRDDTLILAAQGSGSNILAPTGQTLIAQTLDLRAGDPGQPPGGPAPFGQIGEATRPVFVATPNLLTRSQGDQFLASGMFEPASPVIRQAIAGGTVNLASGLFTLDGIMTTTRLAPLVQLQGQGIIFGNLEVGPTAILDPGLADEASGTIFILGQLTLTRTSQVFFDVNPPYLLPGRDYDQLIVGQVDLGGATLRMRGGADLQVTINDLTLIQVLNPGLATGNFEIGGDSSIVALGAGFNDVRIGVSFKGKMFFDGGDGNDIVIRELSLNPPVQTSNYKLISPRLFQFVRTDRFAPTNQPVNEIAPTVEPPLVEEDVENVQVRKIEVRLVLPLDDQGNVSEEKVLELEAAWIKNLQAVFRRLPDDRYRIYLILEGGESRRMMDVIVRDGRPFEPEEARPALSPSANQPLVKPETPLPQPPARTTGGEQGAAAAPALPDLPVFPLSTPAAGPLLEADAPEPASGRMFVGAAAAAASLVAARRSQDRWNEELDAAAEQLAARPRSSRWWRFSGSGRR
ncbi:MAG: hypothetical protein SFU86_17545 [Pirellulaceae bacterium]|nr:hypothetical protein [Pirellulaceae bacterium]